MQRKEVIAQGLPAPNGHYSHAVVFGDAVYVSGVLPMRCSPEASLQAQFEAVMDVAEEILRQSSSALSETVMCRIYIADLNDWPEINRLYAERMGACRPARVVVPVKALHFGYKLEVELMAGLLKSEAT